MTREVWFQLVDEQGNAVTSTDCVDCADDVKVFRLRKAVKEEYKDSHLAGIDVANLLVYASRAAYNDRDGQPLKASASVNDLGKDKDGALIVQVQRRKSGSEPSRRVGFLTYADGINPTSDHLNRDHILMRMADWITGEEGRNRFLLLNSPTASGKTSLLNLFEYKYPGINACRVSFKLSMTPWEILGVNGLDLIQGRCAYENVVFMIDDAQCQYGDVNFWATLIKEVPLIVSPGVRFIISATHVSTQVQSSPAILSDFETITREDLLLSDEQSQLFLSMGEPLGLSRNMRYFSGLKKTIIEHCNGLIGALCQSVAFYADHFRHHVPTEAECLQAFYSKNLLETMGCCFGTVDQPGLPLEANDALLKCVLGERIHSFLPMDESLSRALASFAKAGILIIDEHRYYVFSSLLAKRFFTHRYFPYRAEKDPSSLRELVMNVIQCMSATSLEASLHPPPRLLSMDASSSDDFPKVTTFQHFFALGLLQNTTVNTAICSELSRSVATSAKVKGEIDFFVGGDSMWGIELVRSGGSEIGEHMSRFSRNGKYAGLQSSDYVVVDFRKGVANVVQDPHKATVFFPIDDAKGRTRFCEVVVKYGNDEAVTLRLQS